MNIIEFQPSKYARLFSFADSDKELELEKSRENFKNGGSSGCVMQLPEISKEWALKLIKKYNSTVFFRCHDGKVIDLKSITSYSEIRVKEAEKYLGIKLS